MIVVDASALTAILVREPERNALLAALETLDGLATSPVTVFEATMAVRRSLGLSVGEAEQAVVAFLDSAHIEIVPVDANTTHLALAAAETYGRGTGSPAQLNMGDCFTYGLAKALNAKLLFKGDDFSRTDIEPALFAAI